ncbi:MAG: DUF1800 domain-containing protein [Actinomycetota bacterium]|nr:DUF1800 domain-containing protein [Actinomycetota bacterium]
MDNATSDIAHLLRRAGFGAGPAELATATSAGYPATVERLLAGGGSAPDPTGDRIAVPTFTPYQKVAAKHGSPQALAAARAQKKVLSAELPALQAWWLNRMLVTSTPLREKMTLLWHGHFATAVKKVKDPHLMYLQNQLFRTAGMGSFEDLTQAVAKGGAMMVWLDTEKDKKAHANENFSRELMELFTLGLGNYTQTDVEQSARCFTGWTYDRTTDVWSVQARQHDNGTKTFLGRTGNLSGEDAISTILTQPASARFVVAKVWSHLAYPVPTTDPVVGQLVSAYAPSFNITDLLRAVFNHPAFLSPTAKTGLVKQPIEYLVGAARALRLDASGARLDPSTGLPVPPPPTQAKSRVGLAQAATTLAQTPFDPSNVGGWPQNGYWLNTATALARTRIAELLAARADLSAIEAAPLSQRMAAVAQMLGVVDGWGPTTAGALAGAARDPASLVALALTSPEYVLN